MCFHCFTPCVVIHRVWVRRDGPWESVCDVCWAHRCDGNPDYQYGGLWASGRLSQPGEQKPTAQKKPRKRPGKKGPAAGKARRSGPGRP